MKITLKPSGDIDNRLTEGLRRRLNQVFGCPTTTVPETYDLGQAYEPKRKQYLASKLLTRLKESGVSWNEKVLGIVDVDLYAPGLNFVFGQADVMAGVAVISLCRLRQEYYGLPADEAIFLDRVTKEAVHELGHTFGLGHCPDIKCVMHFSNSLADTDWKEVTFCSKCRPKLIK